MRCMLSCPAQSFLDELYRRQIINLDKPVLRRTRVVQHGFGWIAPGMSKIVVMSNIDGSDSESADLDCPQIILHWFAGVFCSSPTICFHGGRWRGRR